MNQNSGKVRRAMETELQADEPGSGPKGQMSQRDSGKTLLFYVTPQCGDLQSGCITSTCSHIAKELPAPQESVERLRSLLKCVDAEEPERSALATYLHICRASSDLSTQTVNDEPSDSNAAASLAESFKENAKS